MTADVAEAEGLHQLKLSGTKFRKMLRAGEDIPEWCAHHLPWPALRTPAGLIPMATTAVGYLLRRFAFKSVVDVLRKETT